MLKKFTMCLTAICAATISAASFAQTFTTTRVISGLSLPLYVTAPPGDTSRLFIVEQRGNPNATSARIMILDLTTNPPTLLPTPFLTISGVSTGNEQGLLGMAFHPDYASNRAFFVNYTAGGQTRIARYLTSTANPNVADPASATIILSFTQPESNHNGGWIGFGPDGYLYIASGDGGGAGDAHGAIGNGQNLNTLLGKILRISVSDTGTYTVPSTNPYTGATPPFNTVWAWGLRNPFRCAFDRLTGELWIGDVGQNAIEEISYQPADINGSMGGRNYGWRCYEGNNPFNPGACGTFPPASMIYPVHQYSHGAGLCVIGGYAYRGSVSSLQGHYFFADNSSNQIWSFHYTGVNNPPVTNRTAQLAPGGGLSITNITSFGEDAAGEMYLVDRAGEVFKVIPGAPANDTCANAILVSNGATNFNSASATTDGPDEGASCFSGSTQIVNDVWYKYLATCDGTATVSLCGATFDTRLAVYGSCPTGPGQLLACNDNACGNASEVSFPVVANTLYRVRIGGATAATGTGTMTITCAAPPACAPDVNGDNVVNVADLLAVIGNWGPCPGCAADVNNDDQVNVSDLLAVIAGWGDCP
jgi:glucose/arabinose dehydrogenase